MACSSALRCLLIEAAHVNMHALSGKLSLVIPSPPQCKERIKGLFHLERFSVDDVAAALVARVLSLLLLIDRNVPVSPR